MKGGIEEIRVSAVSETPGAIMAKTQICKSSHRRHCLFEDVETVGLRSTEGLDRHPSRRRGLYANGAGRNDRP